MLAAVAALVLTACSSLVTDYRAEAEKLEKEISAMPGVQSVDVAYASDFFLGDNYFRLGAHLPDATEPQISDVINRIKELLGNFGGSRDRSIELVVGDRARVGTTKYFEVAPFLDAIRNVRQYTASVPDGRIFWDVRPTPAISVSDGKTSTAEPLAAIRAMIGATTAADVSIETSEHGQWSVDLPLSAEREAEFRRQLSEIPLATMMVVIEDSYLTELSVRNRVPSTFDPDLAYDQLADTVTKLGPTTDHPLRLRWTWLFFYTDGKANEGFVHAAGCDYSIPTVFDDALSGPALTVQRRMREEFDTCR
ncbi:hypothetical protein [Nocardia brasiliensis]|uniref:hypothetical protein n=1 Tax=Nocardia brasiliensis TaxID=37326 RepID=UPI00367156DC